MEAPSQGINSKDALQDKWTPWAASKNNMEEFDQMLLANTTPQDFIDKLNFIKNGQEEVEDFMVVQDDLQCTEEEPPYEQKHELEGDATQVEMLLNINEAKLFRESNLQR